MTAASGEVFASGKCPTCGAPLKPDELLVDLNTNTVAYRGLSVRLPPKRIEFLYALWKAMPKCVSEHKLRVALWGHEADERSRTNLSIYAHDVRKKLRIFGFNVQCVRCVGYRLIKVD